MRGTRGRPCAGRLREIYKGRVVHLRVEEVDAPQRRQRIELEVIRHPGASAVAPLDWNGEVLLIRQYRHAAGGFIYEVPAGKLDGGEAPEACAARELIEEAGVEAGRLDRLGQHPHDARLHRRGDPPLPRARARSRAAEARSTTRCSRSSACRSPARSRCAPAARFATRSACARSSSPSGSSAANSRRSAAAQRVGRAPSHAQVPPKTGRYFQELC